MIMENRVRERRELFAAAKMHICPNCREMMKEVDRVIEDNVSFIWYACQRTNCDGQWLEKRFAAAELV